MLFLEVECLPVDVDIDNIRIDEDVASVNII